MLVDGIDNSSNLRAPPVISKLGSPLVVSNPSSVGLNGGEVSVGGQQRDLSSEALVTVKLEPGLIFLVIP